MAQITTTIGLNSGVDIASLVDSLIDISAARRDALLERTSVLEEEEGALAELSITLLAAQAIATDLGEENLYTEREASSSNSSLLTAKASDGADTGSYEFTVLQTAESQQYVSSGLRSSDSALGSGSLTFRFGDNVERAARLSDLNGGDGVSLGSIRITDRSGATATLDLSAAQDIDDVLDAINHRSSINVTAETDGDHLRLVDNTGQTVSNLKVQEVGRGTTAESLGLAGIDVAASTADGEDLVELSLDTELDILNDGNGVQSAPYFRISPPPSAPEPGAPSTSRRWPAAKRPITSNTNSPSAISSTSSTRPIPTISRPKSPVTANAWSLPTSPREPAPSASRRKMIPAPSMTSA